MHDAQPPDLAALILDQAVDAVIYADRDGVIRLWNDAAAQVFGFSSEEAIGSSLDLIIPERLREGHWKGYRAAVSSGTTRLGGRATLTKGLHKRGTSVYVEMSFSLVKDRANQVVGSVAIARGVGSASSGLDRPTSPPAVATSSIMSNVASVLKEEIARVSRKEIRRETSSLKRSSRTYRSESLHSSGECSSSSAS